jgi:hypothetical protein
MLAAQIVANLACVFIGGFITWLVAQCYYKKAAKDLEKEAMELGRQINYLLMGMESMNWLTLNRDAQGNIVGFVFKINTQGALHTQGITSPILTQGEKSKG